MTVLPLLLHMYLPMSLTVAFLVYHSFSLELLAFADGFEFWKFQVTGPSSSHLSLNSSPLFTTSEDSSRGSEPPGGKKKAQNKMPVNRTLFFPAAKLLFIVVYMQSIFWELFLKNTKLQWHCAILQTPFGL